MRALIRARTRLTRGLEILVVGLVGNADQAAAYFVQSEQSPLESPDERVSVSAIYASVGEFERATRLLEAAAADARESARYLLALARIDALRQDFESAAAHLRRVIEIDPVNAAAILGLVELALQKEDVVDARAWLARAPDSALRVLWSARIAAAEGRLEEAAALSARAFAMQPSADLAVRAYAAAREAALPEPESVLLEWLETDPQDAEVNFILGTLAMERGQQTEAIRRHELALEAEPYDARVLNNLAWLYDQQGDDRAIETGRKALKLLPESPEILDTVGWMLVRKGDLDRGIEMLETAHRTAPKQGDIAYHLAVALNEAGRTSEARRTLERILDAQVKFSELANAQKLLKELGG